MVDLDSRNVAGDSLALDPSDAGRRARYGGRLRREREAAGLSQREAAERSGVAQSTLSRAELGREVAEEALVALEALYGVRDAYPLAPKDPVRREAWFARRNAQMRPKAPPSGVFGAGKAPVEA